MEGTVLTEQAKADRKAGRFGVVPGDEREFIPLPDMQPPTCAEGQDVSDGSPTN